MIPLDSVQLVQRLHLSLIVRSLGSPTVIVEWNGTDLSFLREISFAFNNFLGNLFVALCIGISTLLLLVLDNLPDDRAIIKTSWRLLLVGHH